MDHSPIPCYKEPFFGIEASKMCLFGHQEMGFHQSWASCQKHQAEPSRFSHHITKCFDCQALQTYKLILPNYVILDEASGVFWGPKMKQWTPWKLVVFHLQWSAGVGRPHNLKTRSRRSYSPCRQGTLTWGQEFVPMDLQHGRFSDFVESNITINYGRYVCVLCIYVYVSMCTYVYVCVCI